MVVQTAFQVTFSDGADMSFKCLGGGGRTGWSNDDEGLWWRIALSKGYGFRVPSWVKRQYSPGHKVEV